MFLLPMSNMRTEDVNNLPLPEGYIHHLSHPAYVSREAAVQKGFQFVGNDACPGVSWKYGPVRFERYVGDVTPEVREDGPLRLVTWQRMMRKDAPAGWKESRFVMRSSRMGFATVDGDPAYYKHWSSHAQRHRKQWLKHDWEIATVSMEDYLAAYKYATMDKFLKFLFSNLLRQKVKTHGANVKIVGARPRTPHAPVEAGFVHVDVPEAQQSIHLMSFHTERAKDVSAGTGLMDYWFQYAPTAGIRYLDFGCFWTPGEPNSWKGFSHFKGQFGLQFVDFPRPMARWAGKRPWPLR